MQNRNKNHKVSSQNKNSQNKTKNQKNPNQDENVKDPGRIAASIEGHSPAGGDAVHHRRASQTDPLGSWTGLPSPENGERRSQQDADDL